MKTPQERKAISETKIKAQGIGIFEGLPMIPPADEVTLKSFDEICKRAIASLICTQIACEIAEENYKEIGFFVDMLKKYGVSDCLNEKENHLVSGMFSRQDALDVVWEYECYWSLVWVLGLIADIQDASQICDCEKAVHLVAECSSYEDFKSHCNPRDVEEILDMLDLYYRYHWACVQNRHIDKNCSIGNLNEEVVYERRRGLEWLISEERDWHNIELHT